MFEVNNFSTFSTDFEIASKSKGVCIHTHNKEVLRCKSGETVSRRLLVDFRNGQTDTIASIISLFRFAAVTKLLGLTNETSGRLKASYS